MPLKYNHKRIKQSLDHAKMQGTYDDEDLEMEREGWRAFPVFLLGAILAAIGIGTVVHFIIWSL